MKISYGWLKELVALDMPPEELSKRLLLLGFEVEELIKTGPALSGVVVAQVLSVQKHPNADRLNLCEVSDGSQKLSVVCGAPNVAAGQKVALAKVGATLPGGITISRAKIRGAQSEGMICSAAELGLGLGGKEGIHVLSADAPLGEDFSLLLGGSDCILDVNITPNRPDCLSHFGLARELSIYLDLPLKMPQVPDFPEARLGSVPVEILEPESCPRYVGRVLGGIKIAPSPAWLAKRLEAVGLRPINNVVDVTNYVLMETGQPLHAFDLDKLAGPRIRVRSAAAGERIRALDGREYALSPENLVIADEKKAVAIAGVIGGQDSGVSETSTRVFLESAHFAPGRVRRSARALSLRTDSSYRFERGTDASAPPWAARRAASLILQLSLGSQAGPALDLYPKPAQRPAIEVSSTRINAILGSSYPEPKVEAVLRRIGERCEGSDEKLRLFPPSHRLDLESAWDLAEEIGRLLGYAEIPYANSPARLPEPETLGLHEAADFFRRTMSGLGLREAYNYDFISAAEAARFGLDPQSPELARVSNPLSEDWALLRPTLLIGLLRNARMNFNRGASDVPLFEIGRTYARSGSGVAERTRVAALLAGGGWPQPRWWKGRALEQNLFFTAKGMAETLASGLDFEWLPAGEDGTFLPAACLELRLKSGPVVGRVGLLHPELTSRWDLRSPVAAALALDLETLTSEGVKRFKPFSVFPSSSRDISLLIDDAVSFGEILLFAKAHLRKSPEFKDIDLVDQYTGEKLPAGKKSLTFRLTFSRDDRTLRDEEVSSATDSLVRALESRFGASLRA